MYQKASSDFDEEEDATSERLFTQSEYLVANAVVPRSTIVIRENNGEQKENAERRQHDNQEVFGKVVYAIII